MSFLHYTVVHLCYSLYILYLYVVFTYCIFENELFKIYYQRGLCNLSINLNLNFAYNNSENNIIYYF